MNLNHVSDMKTYAQLSAKSQLEERRAFIFRHDWFVGDPACIFIIIIFFFDTLNL